MLLMIEFAKVGKIKERPLFQILEKLFIISLFHKNGNKKRVGVQLHIHSFYLNRFFYLPPNMSPSTYNRTISCLALVLNVIDFLK